MLGVSILGVSIVLQFVAAGIALYLIKVTGRRRAWIFIAVALTLMGVRRSITFSREVFGDAPLPVDITAEIVALTISVLMVLGVALIGPLFKRTQQAQSDLRESEQRFRDFASAAADRFWETDKDLRAVYVSDSPAGFDGQPPSIQNGKKRWEIDGIDADSEGWRNNRAIMEAHQPFKDFLFTRKLADGSIAYRSSSGIPMFDEEGVFKGYRGATADRTEFVQSQKKALEIQERSIQAIENASDGIAIWGPDERLIMCNTAYKNTHPHLTDILEPGLVFEEFIRLQAASGHVSLTVGGDDDFVASRLTEHRRQGGSDSEVMIDGSTFRIRKQMLPDGSVIAFHTDVTDMRQYDAQLRQAQKMEAVGQLSGGIAHDFNNMLSVISGNIQLALRMPGDPKNEDRFESALEGARRVASLTQRLLAYSRQQTLDPVTTDVAELIDGLLGLINSSLGETIRINVEIGPGLNDVEADQNQLENAILNLSLNARDAMPGGGELIISAHNQRVDEKFRRDHPEAKLGNYVTIAVEDGGRGIPENTIGKVFDPFFSTKDVGKGSGLGLSMVYGFVSQSGGFVTIDSEPDIGTTVAMHFPSLEIAARENDEASEAMPDFHGRGERVMVIEDDDDVREVTIAALEALGYEVIDGGDGSQAIEKLHQQKMPIDLLLSDVTLPNGNNGSDIARSIQEKWGATKVLLVSGYSQETLSQDGDGEPAYPLLPKPFEMNTLAKRIHELIHAEDGRPAQTVH